MDEQTQTDTGTPGTNAPDTATSNGPATDSSSTLVDKTLADIKADADKMAGTVEDDAKGEVDVVETKVRHAGHDVLDEMEQHLSQFGHYEVAVYHGFVQRLRALL